MHEPQRVYEAQYLGRASIIKQRFKKKYRHPTLDAKLTKGRLAMVCTLVQCCAVWCGSCTRQETACWPVYATQARRSP